MGNVAPKNNIIQESAFIFSPPETMLSLLKIITSNSPELQARTFCKLCDFVPDLKADKHWREFYQSKGFHPQGKRFYHKFKGRLENEKKKKRTNAMANKLIGMEMPCYDCGRMLWRLPWKKRDSVMYVWTTPERTGVICVRIGRFYAKKMLKLRKDCEELKLSFNWLPRNRVPVCLPCIVDRGTKNQRSVNARMTKAERKYFLKITAKNKFEAREIFRGELEDSYYFW
jgi:hypothetical protein